MANGLAGYGSYGGLAGSQVPGTDLSAIFNQQGYGIQPQIAAPTIPQIGAQPNLGTDTGTGLDFGMKGVGGAALGAAQLGLAGLSYFDQKKTADKQRELMSQQVKSNEYSLAQTKQFRDKTRQAFG